MKKAALFLSPHLDDVAFSCGGTLLELVSDGWDVSLCTAFTASVSQPQGFALSCQLDKGLPADVDYMALRREEDSRFARVAGVTECIHLPFREAPHRGYESAAELFAGSHNDDRIWMSLASEIKQRAAHFDFIFGPQGIGNHADHLQLIRAMIEAGVKQRAHWYPDTPYIIRHPSASRASELPNHLVPEQIRIDVRRKAELCNLYLTQVPFQFGARETLDQKLETLHRSSDGYFENLLRSAEATPLF